MPALRSGGSSHLSPATDAASGDARVPLTRFLGPRYWPIWVLLGVLRLAVLLPWGVQLALGRAIGRLALPLLHTRRSNAERNIALCLPELDAPARAALLRRHFESLGVALFETAMTWWAGVGRLRRLARPEGLEALERHLDQGRGVLLVPSHFTTMEIGAGLLSLFVTPHIVYQRHSNPLVEEMMRRRRGRAGARLIHSTAPRAAVRALGSGQLVWYPPDQTYPPKNRVLAPFFGIPAMTNTTPGRLARLTGAVVVPYQCLRLDDGAGYRLLIGPALEDFPGEDVTADAARLNGLVEEQVRRAPEQYLWIHRRFRAYAPDYPDYYAG